MLDQWLEKHQDKIETSYLCRRRERDDSRSEEVIRTSGRLLVSLLVQSLRGEIDWGQTIAMNGRRMLKTGHTSPSAATESMYTAYLCMAEILAREEPEQRFEWLSILSEYMLNGSQVISKVLETSLEEQVAERTAELRASEETVRAILNATNDVMLLLDTNGNILTTNEAASRRFGKSPDEMVGQSIYSFFPADLAETRRGYLEEVVKSGNPFRFEDERADRYYDSSIYPVFDEQGQVAKLTVYTRDVTGRKQTQIEQARLQQEIIEAQSRAIQELSTPIIPLMDRIIVMPLIGSIDSHRARDITRSLLAGIRTHRAKVVIMDITGVPLVDSGVANHLNKTIQAARLKGARTIVTGVSDSVAETIIDLGIDWSGVETLADLQTGLIVALHSLGIQLSR